MLEEPTLNVLQQAVAGTASAFRCRQNTAKKPLKEDLYAPAAPLAETPSAAGTVFGVHPVVLTLEPEDAPYSHLDLLSVLAVAQRWREAILSKSNGLPDRVRELLSGHSRDGAPLEGPHLAFLPLAFVEHRHADGRLLGMALALPADISHDDRRLALRAIGSVRRLTLDGDLDLTQMLARGKARVGSQGQEDAS